MGVRVKGWCPPTPPPNPPPPPPPTPPHPPTPPKNKKPQPLNKPPLIHPLNPNQQTLPPNLIITTSKVGHTIKTGVSRSGRPHDWLSFIFGTIIALSTATAEERLEAGTPISPARCHPRLASRGLAKGRKGRRHQRPPPPPPPPPHPPPPPPPTPTYPFTYHHYKPPPLPHHHNLIQLRSRHTSYPPPMSLTSSRP